MQNFLRNARQWLNDTLQESSGYDIAYQRGSSSVSITALIGGGSLGQVDGNGYQIAFMTTDFIISSQDLVINGQETEPQRGDVITCEGIEYIVVSDQEGEKPFRRSGHTKDFYRVMTKIKRGS